MEKLKMHSPDLTQANIAQIAQLFPNVVTESLDSDGKAVRAIDFDLLRQELSGHIVEGPQERYQLDWPGKRAAAFAANTPIAKTLRPVREDSVNFDTTKNLFIEGDNLDALKLLQESYLGQIKLIFIDPPYNTGSDSLAYPDDFTVESSEYLALSGQTDSHGLRLRANTESNGRFHSDWLTMMYPRLRLARNLLSSDGLICIAIDDNEGSALDAIGREIFGERNFVARVIWKHTEQSKNDEPYFSRHHNYLVMLRRSEELGRFRLPRNAADNKAYSNPDNDPRGPWRSGDVRSPSPRPSLRFPVETPSGNLIQPPENGWRWSEESIRQKVATGEIVFRESDTRLVRKIYLSEQEGRTPETVWLGEVAGTTRQANAEIKEIFGATIFDTPKPTRLIRRVLDLLASPDALVLDFFAGSASTADAVMRQNAEDGGARRFIMIQISEPCGPATEAAKAGFSTIAEISKERIRRAGLRVSALQGSDVGFRVLKVDTTNMMEMKRPADDLIQASLTEAVDSVKPDRTDEDLLFQVLIDWGIDLSLPIGKLSFERERERERETRAPRSSSSTTVHSSHASAKRCPLMWSPRLPSANPFARFSAIRRSSRTRRASTPSNSSASSRRTPRSRRCDRASAVPAHLVGRA